MGHQNTRIYGYYTSAEQTEPEYDPGLEVDCPVCNKVLSRPMVTISLKLQTDAGRSYFYRAHKDCYDNLTEEQQSVFDSPIIDAEYATRNVN